MMEAASGVGMNTIDVDDKVTGQIESPALDSLPKQHGKKRKNDTSSEPLDKSAQKGEEGLTSKRAKTTDDPEASETNPLSTVTVEVNATEALTEVRKGKDEINALTKDLDARADDGDIAEGGQLVVDTDSGEVSTREGDGDSSVAGSVVPLVGKVAPVVPRGRCVSGRVWKTRQQSQRASLQVTTATVTLSTSWKKKLEIKAKRQAAIALEQEMRDRKRQEIEDKKLERLERERRRQRNEMKNTTYHTISKTHKLKTMNKKQLRQIKKRQINSRTGEVEFVSPWGGGKK